MGEALPYPEEHIQPPGPTMSKEPQFKDDPLYRLLREGRIDLFNAEKRRGVKLDLTHADFRGINLQGLDAEGLDLSGCYFRQADLRGLDLRQTRLEGASIHGAKVAGVYFPEDLSAEEIQLSLLQGTRMRMR